MEIRVAVKKRLENFVLAADFKVAGNIPGVTQTIPLAIYEYASSPTSETMALSLCIVSVCMALGILFLHEVLGKKLSQRR